MHPNEELLKDFYLSLQARDAAAMTACYAPVVTFSDPAFGKLDGPLVTGMWHMLCARSRDLQVSANQIRADDQVGSAHWEADYIFGRPGRRVHNVIDAAFVFKDGKIIEHTDRFDFWRWSRMALGLPGWLLGWTPLLRAVVQKSTNQQLEEYMQAHPATSVDILDR